MSGQFESMPSTPSSAATTWYCSGWRASIFEPRLLTPFHWRPAHDISTPLRGGPTDCEAAEPSPIPAAAEAGLPLKTSVAERSSVLERPDRIGPDELFTPALAVRPNGFCPLKTSLARPSQKLCRLK